MTDVLIYAECPWVPSSIGKVTLHLVKGLQEEGYRVVVACPAAGPTLQGWGMLYDPGAWCYEPCVDTPEPFRVVPASISIAGEYERARAEGYEYEYIIVYGTPYGSPTREQLASLEKKRPPAPVVGYFISETLTMPRVFTRPLRLVDLVAAPTRWVLESFKAAMEPGDAEWLEEHSHVVPHGLDAEVYKPENIEDMERFTATDAPVVGLIAKNMVRKNPYPLLHAVAELRRRGRRVYAALFLIKAVASGHWDLPVVLDHVITETGVDINPVYTIVEEVASMGTDERGILQYYANIDILGFTSMGEAFGLPLLESALLEKPFTATAHPAIVDAWRGSPAEDYLVPYTPVWHSSGFKLAQPDHEALADAIERLLDPGERERIGRSLRRYALNRYTYKHMTRAMIDAMEKARRLWSGPR